MLHYNFPPFSVGEAGMVGSLKKGNRPWEASKRALEAVLPNTDDFEYAIRVVSEITESNGSSSMATVCCFKSSNDGCWNTSKKPVAGVAMGLVKTDEQHCVITDILGDEDHLGDMDFKVARTDCGVTALQMDIKITGINEQILEDALSKAHTARNHILDEMNKVLSQSREELSPLAPQAIEIKIPKIKLVKLLVKVGQT